MELSEEGIDCPWYCYDGETFHRCETREQAENWAADIMDKCQDYYTALGMWPAITRSISWGSVHGATKEKHDE